jgi:hypothetical protein
MDHFERNQIEHPDNQEQFDRLAGEARLRSIEGPVGDKTYPNSIEFVDVDRLPETPEIRGPQDFSGKTLADRQANYESLKRDLLRHEQMRPYIEQGHGSETWDAWDQQTGIGNFSPAGYERGYADVYRAYYDTVNAVAVSEVDSQYTDILNGRHRIFLARELGIQKLPVNVRHS